jgi:hypothetical protein
VEAGFRGLISWPKAHPGQSTSQKARTMYRPYTQRMQQAQGNRLFSRGIECKACIPSNGWKSLYHGLLRAGMHPEQE